MMKTAGMATLVLEVIALDLNVAELAGMHKKLINTKGWEDDE